ncbi:hypothetical protein, partial [Acetobacter senegalensis]|uniref:hypothetical protein n=1 Tax=Acetobacter senegalensis TaxID=446692 RepID=UPI00264E3AD4
SAAPWAAFCVPDTHAGGTLKRSVFASLQGRSKLKGILGGSTKGRIVVNYPDHPAQLRKGWA